MEEEVLPLFCRFRRRMVVLSENDPLSEVKGPTRNPNQEVPMAEKQCALPKQNREQVEVVVLRPERSPADYQEAMSLAKEVAAARFDDWMLVSWYDRDRDVESPAHATECAEGCAKTGYIDYALSHGATLRVEVEDGRFVFFFTPVQW